MQLEAVYNRGTLEFKQPVQFHHEQFSVMVDIPEQEVVTIEPESFKRMKYNLPPEVFAEAEKMRSQLDDIMNMPLPSDSELPPLTQKRVERISAFSLRENR